MAGCAILHRGERRLGADIDTGMLDLLHLRLLSIQREKVNTFTFLMIQGVFQTINKQINRVRPFSKCT